MTICNQLVAVGNAMARRQAIESKDCKAKPSAVCYGKHLQGLEKQVLAGQQGDRFLLEDKTMVKASI